MPLSVGASSRNETMNTFLQQIQQLWARQSFMGKTVLGGATAVLVLVVAAVGYWSSQTSYAVLYSGLPTEEAAAITQKLEADKVAYKLSSDGTTILVPAERVQKTRMGLAVAGLLHGSEKGYEIFDSMSMGATPFVQNMNYTRAIQGELARTIMTLEPVVHARVHIVQPDPSPFVREEKPVTASVVIKTRPGGALGRAATQGIVALVAGSVKGLTPDNVTVLDTEGTVLSEKKKSAQSLASTEQLAHQLEVESHLASKAQEILTRLLGPGRAIVRVTADMSFRHVREVSEKFDPEGKVVARESVMSSKTTAAGGPRGPAGTASNVPPVQPGAAGPATPGPSANEEVIESEYLVSHSNHSQEEQQETINRLTVAVMLIPPIPVDETPLEESLGVTPNEAGQLVKQAVGFKEGRDQIQVSIGKPPESPAEAVLDQQILSAQNWQNYGQVAKGSSLGVAALALLAIGLLSLRRKPVPAAPDPAPAMAISSLPSNSAGSPVVAPAMTSMAAGSTSGMFSPGPQATVPGAVGMSPVHGGMSPGFNPMQSAQPGMPSSAPPSEFDEIHAIAGAIRAWLEEPATIRLDRTKPAAS